MSKKQLTHENGAHSTSNLKTAKEWFLTMGEPISAYAIDNSNYEKLHLFYPSLEGALENTFDWSLSNEGRDYWLNIFEKLSLVDGIEEEEKKEIDQEAINRRLSESISDYEAMVNHLLSIRAQISADLTNANKFLTDLKLIRDGQK